MKWTWCFKKETKEKVLSEMCISDEFKARLKLLLSNPYRLEKSTEQDLYFSS